MRRFATICCALTLAAVSSAASAQTKPDAKDMALVGTNDLQGRAAYQPSIHEQNGRWIAYIGHHGGTDADPKPLNSITGQHEFNGTSIVDVTDPQHPKYLAHIPGEEGLYEGGGAQMTRVCNGKELPKGDPKAVYLLRVFGNSAHEIWNTADPAHPVLVSRIDGLKGTHKNFWECDTGIAYLVSGAPGWRVPRMTQIYDLSDPAHPVKIRDFGLPGQQPGAEGPAPIALHGAISTGPKGNRVYFGYGTNDRGLLQIVDRDKLLNGPKEPTDENLRAPEVGRLELSPLNGAHTVLPILDMPIAEFAKDKVGKARNFVVVTDEQILNECQEARQFVWFVDITVEKHPASVATWGVPESPGDFCSRGGRFGTHSSNENMTPIYYKKLMFFAHFNAGLRAVDIRDPYHPREVAHYIPAVTKNTDKRCTKRADGTEHCAVVIQTNNVEVDDRGYIYIVDRANTGMHILSLTGAAREIASFPQR
ncbi:MAG: hypothetical protein JWL84_5622 [Rhodospirillales bacterium]|nr:hypothetical protein [Rhodospirillales bacterium]